MVKCVAYRNQDGSSAGETRLPVREPTLSRLRVSMSMVRRSAVLVIAIISLTAAACTTTAVKPRGIVTGYADACVGILPAGETVNMSALHVKVALYSGAKSVASETARSGATYRFSVAPGAYWVKGRWGSEAVTVRPGHLVTADIGACG